MYYLKIKYLFLIQSILTLIVFSSCSKKFDDEDYTAYFRGEILNPTTNFVLFCKDDVVLDTLFLDEHNFFEKSFDSLTPGMYVYKHNPEFQYVYFEKNDSINLRLNTRDFDHSIIFSGRGAEKNNFLMQLNTKNLVDRNKLYEYYDASIPDFIRRTDSAHAARTSFYLRSKAKTNWSKDFDTYAKAMLDLHFFSQKEIYPIAHLVRNHNDLRGKLPTDYYDFRKRIDFNNEKLVDFSSFTKYLAFMLSSEVEQTEIEFNSEASFDKNIEKLNIIDTLIHNEKVKNTILDKIAFLYLLDDQNVVNNELFLKRYFELSSDTGQHNEIFKIQNSIQKLKLEKRLPEVPLVDLSNQMVSINSLITKPTLIFFWTKGALAHFDAAHRRAISLLEEDPDLQIIAISIDADHTAWLDQIKDYPHKNIIELRSTDFQLMKDLWIITKIQRAMTLNSDGTLHNSFVNLFDTTIIQKLNTIKDQ